MTFTFWGRSRWLADACQCLLWAGTVGVGGRLPNNLKKMENIVFVLNYERHWINERLKLLFFKLANLNRERLDRGPWQQTTGWHWVPAKNCDEERGLNFFWHFWFCNWCKWLITVMNHLFVLFASSYGWFKFMVLFDAYARQVWQEKKMCSNFYFLYTWPACLLCDRIQATLS